ncbi:hypothetical protein AHF37_11407 [Paragonimus kellicotti]|nr:hypothetical protein AHF37_11407 [Paragonimus kellicotti]
MSEYTAHPPFNTWHHFPTLTYFYFVTNSPRAFSVYCYTQVKAALTRAFNKSAHLLPYATAAITKGRSKRVATGLSVNGGGELGDEDIDADGLFESDDGPVKKEEGTVDQDEEEDIQSDAMIIKKKRTVKSDAVQSGAKKAKVKPDSTDGKPPSKSSTSGRGRAKARP